MLNEERRAAIVQLLHEQGKVEVRDLSRRFGTSDATIRNDLNDLQRHGVLKRAHGGAVRVDPSTFDPALDIKTRLHSDEKRRIGVAAAALVDDGSSILLDSGSTTHQVARHIKGKKNITVITNGVNIATELVGVPGLQLILLGGRVRDNSVSVVGQSAVEMLERLSVDTLFMAVDACDLEFGLTTPNLDECLVNQAMLRVARRKILVADSTKFGHRSLSLIAPVTAIDTVITDTHLEADVRRGLAERSIEVVLV